MAVEVSVKKLRHYWPIYLLIALPLALVLIFSYFPIYNGFIHIFYRWNGSNIEEFVGLQNIRLMLGDRTLWHSFGVVGLFIAANLIKMILPIITAVVLHHVINDRAGYVYRVLFVVPMVIPAMVAILMWKYFYEPNSGLFNAFLRMAGLIGPMESIQWLSDRWLTVPALIFVGFPWVGAFGVLIYLAGLQSISEDIYEAAEIDGAGAWRIFTNIELPLIVTQIRINLLLMMINTVQAWQNVYLYVGIDGGPDSVAMVPGLLIFRDAFSRGNFGYGCAIGFVIFLVTFVLTFINNKFVRTQK